MEKWEGFGLQDPADIHSSAHLLFCTSTPQKKISIPKKSTEGKKIHIDSTNLKRLENILFCSCQ
jgi:hypothetical protein